MPVAIDKSADFAFAVFTVNLYGALNSPHECTTVVIGCAFAGAHARRRLRRGEREERKRLLYGTLHIEIMCLKTIDCPRLGSPRRAVTARRLDDERVAPLGGGPI